MMRWGFLSALLLICSQFCLAQAPATNGEAAEPAVLTYEQHKQAAIRINELAGRIHSETDANAFVSEIAGLLTKELPPAWTSSGIRQRLAHAEYEAVRDPARLIPEQRLAVVYCELNRRESKYVFLRGLQALRCLTHLGYYDAIAARPRVLTKACWARVCCEST
jgi:hypothetical protein